MPCPAPNEPDRERYPNGRAKSIEGPTPETARKYQDRAQTYHIPAHNQASNAESTIGILEARGHISIEKEELCKNLLTCAQSSMAAATPSAAASRTAVGDYRTTRRSGHARDMGCIR